MTMAVDPDDAVTRLRAEFAGSIERIEVFTGHQDAIGNYLTIRWARNGIDAAWANHEVRA